MAKAGGMGGGASSIVTDADGVTTDAYAEVFEDVASALLGIGTITNPGAGTAAAGGGTSPLPALIVLGSTFTLDDSVNPATTFEFVRGGAPAPGSVGIDILGFTTKNQVRAQVVIEVNAAAGLDITASPGAIDGRFQFVNDAVGSAGNIAIGFTGTSLTYFGMSGGTDGGNSMTVRETVTDRFGVTDATTETVVAAGAAFDYLLNPQAFFGAARPPYVSYKVEVKATVPGSQTSYSLRFGAQGED